MLDNHTYTITVYFYSSLVSSMVDTNGYYVFCILGTLYMGAPYKIYLISKFIVDMELSSTGAHQH